MKNIITTALVLLLAFGFVFFYKKSSDLLKENQELAQDFQNLSTQILLDYDK